MSKDMDDLQWIIDCRINPFNDMPQVFLIDKPISYNEMVLIVRDVYSSGQQIGERTNDADTYITRHGELLYEYIENSFKSHGCTLIRMTEYGFYLVSSDMRMKDGVSHVLYSETY